MSSNAAVNAPETASADEQAPLLGALAAVLAPMARLAVARGLPFAAVEEQLKVAFIAAAREAQAGSGQPAHRLVSRISTTTGINRREVTRITQAPAQVAAPKAVSLASEVFTRWRSDRQWLKRGEPKVLPRVGPTGSFEALARSVTQDVHPRSLLDELCRIGLAHHDPAADTVSLAQEAFVPRGDWQRMLAFLGDNVGDHLQGAVDNVLDNGARHFEQAIFADELSVESLGALRDVVRRYWQQMLHEVVPLLEQGIEADRAAGRPQDQRVRLGLFTYQAPMAGPAADAVEPPPPAAKPTRGRAAPAKAAPRAGAKKVAPVAGKVAGKAVAKTVKGVRAAARRKGA